MALITPFNFPLEIPCLQLFGALMVGNRPLIKNDNRVALVMEQFVRMCIDQGLDPKSLDVLHCSNAEMEKLLKLKVFRMHQFTGSSKVAEHLMQVLNGKLKIEDAGFDWKVLGPDVHEVDYVAYQCDQDAYACSGQKCSAQSILFVHENWKSSQLYEKMRARAQ